MMKPTILLLGATSALTMTVSTVPATAATVIPKVYSDQALFASQHTNLTNNSLTFSGTGFKDTTPSYLQAGVTFSVPATQALYELTANATLPASHLAALILGNNTTGAYNISYSGPVLELTLASFYGAQTVSYVVNGVSGSLALGAKGATSFIGFDSGSNGVPVNVSFSFSQQPTLDVLSFQTGASTFVAQAAAVPEPAAWAMMILGMGAIGFAIRRQKVATRVSYAA